MIMNFSESGKYVWADVGEITTDNQLEVVWDSSWDDKKHLLQLVNGAVVVNSNLNYENGRVTEYPPIGDQLDALFHAGVFPAEMAAEIQAVKDKYPK